MHTFLLVLDLVGTFVFALSGGVAGARAKLDLFGVLVLAFVSAIAGGVLRDLLIGTVPPAAISDPRYLVVSTAAGVIAFFWHGLVDRLRHPVLVFDAAGLGLFAVIGTQKALNTGLDPVMAALLGMLSGIGGGIARATLLAEIPAVLKSELYAVAALAGAAIVVVFHLFALPQPVGAVLGALVCFVLRMLAIYRNWRLPIAGER